MISYLKKLGVRLEDVSIDPADIIFIVIEGNEENGDYFYREITIPTKYQTKDNRSLIIKNNRRTLLKVIKK